MIYTLGCSFTKWFWHTWSDWLEEYSQEPVTNLGWPGISNETIYWELMSRRNSISEADTVYVMLTGNNRVSVWYDNNWIEKNDCRGFFPNNNEQLEHGSDPWCGLYRLHPEHDVSLTHMIVDNFNLIYQIQTLLDTTKCRYRLMFWQNPWYDVRPKFEPSWRSVWSVKDQLTKQDLKTADTIMRLKPMHNLIAAIDWDKFYLGPTDPYNPKTYSGMWEYKIKKQVTLEFMNYVHEDPHPDAVIHHDFCTEILLENKIEPIYRARAQRLATASLNHSINLPRDMLIPNSYKEQLKKLYDR